MNFKKQFKEGLLTKNPVTVQLLGMCSTLAITTSLFNGIGMGLAVTIITICSNVLISAYLLVAFLLYSQVFLNIK